MARFPQDNYICPDATTYAQIDEWAVQSAQISPRPCHAKFHRTSPIPQPLTREEHEILYRALTVARDRVRELESLLRIAVGMPFAEDLVKPEPEPLDVPADYDAEYPMRTDTSFRIISQVDFNLRYGGSHQRLGNLTHGATRRQWEMMEESDAARSRSRDR